MYLLPIHVPIYVDGSATFVTTEWHRSLLLLRDSLEGRFGDIVVVAPSLPARTAGREQSLVEIKAGEAGLRLAPSIDRRCRMIKYWQVERRRWRADVAKLLPQAKVVHGAMDDVYRPIAFDAFCDAVRFRDAAGNSPCTVFVQDTDIVAQHRELARTQSLAAKIKAHLYGMVYERWVRRAVGRADLSLLKGSALMDRYGPFARNAKLFHDTSFSERDVLPIDRLEARLTTLATDRPIRLVYCGRFLPRKGLDHGLRILAGARATGANATLDLIGDGSERVRLESLTRSLSLQEVVKFTGSKPYGPELLGELATYDGLLFTPTAEDTPRMIFDGYAAGLPLIAYDIGYVREREREERATALLPRQELEQSAAVLAALCADRPILATLARAAHAAAEYHAAERWYRQRAQWTFEAYDAHAKRSRK